jgi:hypothetical protein
MKMQKKKMKKSIKKNPTSVNKAIGLFRDSWAPSCLSGPQTNVLAEPPLIGPALTTHCLSPR